MGISSLGVGSSILTQDVLDQLREADEAVQIRPIELNLLAEQDKKKALELIDASMTNLIDSIDEIKSNTLYDERTTTVSGSAVSVTADANSDLQDFTLEVTALATKQIEQSGAFTSIDETIANAGTTGTISFSVGDADPIDIAYDENTTLDDLKKLINSEAGDLVDATIVQINSGEFRLFISAVGTGNNQDISMTDTSGNLKDTRLTTDVDVLDLGNGETSAGKNATFTFNGQAIERENNTIDDLIVGLDITLKEVGTSAVSVSQDRTSILKKFASFVEKYNSAITELDKMTQSSVETSEKGIFSSESTIKNMKNQLEYVVGSLGGGVGSMSDYGFDIDRDGKMTLDKTVLEEKLDEDPTNLEAFFAGGTFTNTDGSTTEVDGAFTEYATMIEGYTKYNATLDQFKTSIDDNISAFEDRKISATERLDSRYEIMKKQYAAYDLMISKFNSASSMFSEMVNAQYNA